MVFTKLLLENALAIRFCNCEAVSVPLLPKIALCIPVLPSRYIGKCTARVLKRSGLTFGHYALLKLFPNITKMPWYLMKIVETYLEIIKDGGIVVLLISKVICLFHLAAILDFEERKNGNHFL